MCRGAFRAIGVILASVYPGVAGATYSIAAVDQNTQQVGGAGTSCVGNFSVSVIYASVPGTGVLMAQAYYNQAGRDRARQLVAQGLAPADIIAQITSASFDSDAQRRQYGVVDLAGRAVGFTGRNTGAWAGHVTEEKSPWAYSIQGNILTGEAVVRQAEVGFAQGCDLADRLMLALEAGAANGQGDSRCTPNGIPSDGAFLQVDRPGEPAGAWLRLRVDNTRPANPITLLRNQYDLWRAQNPCPVAQDAGFEDAAAFEDALGFEDALASADVAVSDMADAAELDATEKELDATADAGSATKVEVKVTSAKVKVRCGCNDLGGAVGPWLWFGYRRRRRSEVAAGSRQPAAH